MSVFKTIKDLTMSNVYSLSEKAEGTQYKYGLINHLRDMPADVQKPEKSCSSSKSRFEEDN